MKFINNKTKIMHLVLSMGHGGLERIVNQLASKTPKDTFEILICCLDRGGYFLDDLPDYSVTKVVFSRRRRPLDFSLLFKLIWLLRSERVQVIHSHSGCSFYAAIAGRLGKVKGIIHTDHGRLVPDRNGLILEDRIASMLINAYVSVSNELTAYLRNRVKIHKDRLSTVINGVDTQYFKSFSNIQVKEAKNALNIEEDSQIIGTVCRLDPVKNLVFMIRALEGLLKKRKKAKLLIVGEGPDREAIEDIIGTLELNEKVLLLGKRNDVERILPIFDIFLLTSLSEGTSVTILEAMACERPVIASIVGGNRRIVREGGSGYLFPLNKPDILMDRVTELLKNKKKAREMGKIGREIVENDFSFNQTLQQYMELYLSFASL